jgi:hypothetical protein
VQGESADEAVAFLHAAIQQLPDEYRMQYYARCLIAGSADVARALGDSLSQLIIVLEDAEPGLARRLVERRHHVYGIAGDARCPEHPMQTILCIGSSFIRLSDTGSPSPLGSGRESIGLAFHITRRAATSSSEDARGKAR